MGPKSLAGVEPYSSFTTRRASAKAFQVKLVGSTR
jgi:hypothetical protein